MKEIGLAMILIGSVIFGVMLDARYKLRIKELKAFIIGFERLQGYISYHLTPLAEGCIEASKYLEHGVEKVFKQFGQDVDNRVSLDTEKLWDQALQKETYNYHLKQEDYVILSEFGKRIGAFDKEMQQRNIEYIIKQLTQKTEQLESNMEKTSKMYTGLSILTGVCICILLI